MWVTDSFLAITGGIVAVFLVIMIITWLFDRPQTQADSEAEETFDPFAGGYPVPPLPGQQLPPSPRAGRSPITVAARSGDDTKEDTK